jgi:hypothetical protein
MTETELLHHEAALEPAQIPESDRARLLTLEECVPLLASPDTGAPLVLDEAGHRLVAGTESFPIVDGLPMLFPAAVQPFARPAGLEVPEGGDDALLKYVHMSGLKFGHEPTNIEHSDVHYRRHLYRARRFLRDATGTVVDVGCDSPSLSRVLFPAGVKYVGLEPGYQDRSEFRIIGMAEFLPFCDGALDNVAILTTLDHVLDYQAAIDQAWRVLRPGGTLYLATLIWTHNAQLHRDHTHFHHFRDFEILGSLRDFSIQELHRYPWKGDVHRFGWYIEATK